MKMNLLRSAAFGLLILAPAAAQAQIDQSYTVAKYNDASITDYFGQVFTPTQNTIRGAGAYFFNLTNQSQTFSFQTQLYNANDFSAVAGTAGTSGTLTIAAGTSQFFDIFYSAVGITAGNQYALLFHGDNANVKYGYDEPAAAPASAGYTNGYGFNLYNVDQQTGQGDFESFEQAYDYDFREYSDEVVTPEPASLVFLATGLVGVVGFVRRRRKA